MVAWIKIFLIDRSTIFRTNEHTTGKIHVPIGISRGFSLSTILFLFYNSSLLEKLSQKDDISAVGSVDNIAALVEEKTSEENCNRLFYTHETICKP